jgi:hypothetical protein
VSIIFIEGFDHYASVANLAAANWTINSTSLATLPAGRFAGQAFRHSGNSQRLLSRTIPGTNTLTLGVAMAESRVTTVVAEVLHTGGVPNAG